MWHSVKGVTIPRSRYPDHRDHCHFFPVFDYCYWFKKKTPRYFSSNLKYNCLRFIQLKREGKVKVTLVQPLWLCTGSTAHRGSRCIALLFYDHGTRREWGVSVMPRSLLSPGETRYPLYRRLGGPQGRSRQLRKISPPTGIRSPDRPARSQSLYGLSYLADDIFIQVHVIKSTTMHN